MQATKAQSKPVSVDVLCANLNDIVGRLNLPGRGTPSPTSLAANSNNNVKTPWAAPSLEAYRAFFEELPNDQGHFDCRDDFTKLLHAAKGAAVGFTDEGKTIALEWAAKWNGGVDAAHDEALWNGIRDPHVGWGTLMQTLERINPAGAQRVRDEAAKQAFAQQTIQTQQMFTAAQIGPVQPFKPSQIPPRPWLYGRVMLAGYISGLVSTGGVGKSLILMARAVALATGRELIAGEKPLCAMRVWYHNAEDDDAEALRRLYAVLEHHGIKHADLRDNLILTSGRNLSLRFARMGRDGPEVVPGMVDKIVDTAKRFNVKVIMFDPQGAMHGLPENSNEAMNFLAGVLREIADRTNAAIVIAHHTGKVAAQDMDSAGAHAYRGASAGTDAFRVVEQVRGMTAKEGATFGVAESERHNFVRIDNGKANFAPANGARWLRRTSIKLRNGNATYPSGDEAPTVESWTPPTAMPATASDLALVQNAIAAAPTLPRLDTRSPEYVGWLVADTLGLDAGSHDLPAKDRNPGQAATYARIRAMLDGWLSDGSLVRREERDPHSRKPRPCVGIGTPAVVAEPEPSKGPA